MSLLDDQLIFEIAKKRNYGDVTAKVMHLILTQQHILGLGI